MKRENPKQGEIWKHYKGGKYKIVCIAEHTETNEDMVIYQSCSNFKVWCRPLEMFMSQVFKNSKETGIKYRFTKEDVPTS